MIFDLALALIWIGATYRVWVSVTRSRTVWRTSFTASLVAVAVAFVRLAGTTGSRTSQNTGQKPRDSALFFLLSLL